MKSYLKQKTFSEKASDSFDQSREFPSTVGLLSVPRCVLINESYSICTHLTHDPLDCRKYLRTAPGIIKLKGDTKRFFRFM